MELRESFIPERSFAVTWDVVNRNRVAKRVRFKAGIFYQHPNMFPRHEVTELEETLTPGKRQTLTVTIVVEEGWIGPYLDTDISSRQPFVEIISVEDA